MVQRLPRHLPMRLVPIGKPHVHHERISVVGAFNPIGARLWFQSHRDKSHFPNCPMVAKNLRLEGTSALRSGRRRMIALRDSIEPGRIRSAQSNPCHLPGFLESRRPGPFNSATLCQDRAPGIHSRTSYSNATPSGSFSSNHVSAASTFANTLRCSGSPTCLLVLT
jgi:hypothetical protein